MVTCPGSSTYYDSEQLTRGYSLCMLKVGGRALNGYYRDPYLRTLTPACAELIRRLVDAGLWGC